MSSFAASEEGEEEDGRAAASKSRSRRRATPTIIGGVGIVSALSDFGGGGTGFVLGRRFK